MRVPGSNLLNAAFRLIARQSFNYSVFTGRTPQPNGQYVSNYKSAICITGSAQPVPRDMYEQDGLDFQKSYFNFFIERKTLDVTRDVAGDLIQFQGLYYNAISRTPWYGVDGWDQLMAVEVTAP